MMTFIAIRMDLWIKHFAVCTVTYCEFLSFVYLYVNITEEFQLLRLWILCGDRGTMGSQMKKGKKMEERKLAKCLTVQIW